MEETKPRSTIPLATPTQYVKVVIIWEATTGQPSIRSEFLAINAGTGDISRTTDCEGGFPDGQSIVGTRTVAAWDTNLAEELSKSPIRPYPVPTGKHAIFGTVGSLHNCFYDARNASRERTDFGILSCHDFDYECEEDQSALVACPHTPPVKYLYPVVKCGYI